MAYRLILHVRLFICRTDKLIVTGRPDGFSGLLDAVPQVLLLYFPAPSAAKASIASKSLKLLRRDRGRELTDHTKDRIEIPSCRGRRLDSTELVRNPGSCHLAPTKCERFNENRLPLQILDMRLAHTDEEDCCLLTALTSDESEELPSGASLLNVTVNRLSEERRDRKGTNVQKSLCASLL